MTASVPIIEKTLYIYQESYIIRTGLLLYYDPLLMSYLQSSILSDLNAIDTTLIEHPATGVFPVGINAAGITLELR